jgi:hypothetical protein|tara:strand:- start:44 stop:184 length:141 start_codon:yes stop_codon:yes gene_type:complete
MSETIIISQGKKMQQVVVKTIVKGRKNRKGKPYQISTTKHIKKKNK